jgi:hypothetical protein
MTRQPSLPTPGAELFLLLLSLEKIRHNYHICFMMYKLYSLYNILLNVSYREGYYTVDPSFIETGKSQDKQRLITLVSLSIPKTDYSG